LLGVLLSSPSLAVAAEPPPAQRAALDLLGQGKASEAVEVLAPLAKASPDDAELAHLAAVAHMKADQYDKARPLLERAMARSKPKPPRDLTYNVAVLDLRQKTNAMRSVRELKAVFDAGGADDEPLLNVYGSLLKVVATTPARKSALFTAAAATYVKADAAIEAAHGDGRRRWGSRWVSEAEHAQIEERRAAVGAKVAAARERAAAWDDRLDAAAAQAKVERARANANMPNSLASVLRQMEDAKDALARARADVKAQEAKLPRPTWPKAYEPVVPGAAAAAVAAVDREGTPVADPADPPDAADPPPLVLGTDDPADEGTDPTAAVADAEMTDPAAPEPPADPEPAKPKPPRPTRSTAPPPGGSIFDD
ncbi:MAG TPA: tetratricopeptide repeat protein, partial [Tepidisphaeraceae bacterium]|nr:tetratricopeptide repeat protein [Tepidisphaeraceae bacterium]